MATSSVTLLIIDRLKGGLNGSIGYYDMSFVTSYYRYGTSDHISEEDCGCEAKMTNEFACVVVSDNCLLLSCSRRFLSAQEVRDLIQLLRNSLFGMQNFNQDKEGKQ